tara:strand:- start:3065 stop:3724 length:660 start_codon:yes stop_codon:yes gene_type:complete
MKFLKMITMPMIAIITGCASPGVVTNNTAFYIDTYSPKGSISVVSGEIDVNKSLEFAAYKKKFERKLSLAGYTIEKDTNKAEFIALVAYGIDSGKSSTISTPIFGQTSGGITRSSGTVYGVGGSVNYSVSSYTMPTYGVVGSSIKSRTNYKRAIALDIVEAGSFKEGNPVKVYEGRAKSEGTCSVFAEVFDEILEAMFSDFPGENGRNRKQEVRGVYNC